MVPGENKFISLMPEMCATATSAADEPQALCIIWDVSSGHLESQKAKINLPASTTAQTLMNEVAKRFCYEPDTFQLVLQRINDKEIVHVHEHGEATLKEMGFRCGNNERNSLLIEGKNSQPPKRSQANEMKVKSLNWCESVSDPDPEEQSYVPPPAPPPYTPVLPDVPNSSSCRKETDYVGLVNQAMTCYLNSLLQTLYMTPEFRNALYRWEFDGTEEEGTKSIPFQLQKLFLQLQTSTKPAVGTTELTTSFGWDSSEAWQQHDVQELCRVMFDALEQKFKNTEQSDLISTLYEGKLKDYVKCLECNYESAREDTFLDVPLVVRPFGSSQSYASVGEALQAFVAPEILQGLNQYFCDHCNKKCDAHKGLKFLKFPYLLTLQLKRFDFDPVTMHRRKLNDRVTFPEVLSLNEFIRTDGCEGDSISSIVEEDTACRAPEVFSSADKSSDDDEGIDVDSHGASGDMNDELCMSETNLKKALEKGPYVYELFSIMVHSGNANGGHYYAYIKSFKNGEWYCFNDAQVSNITYEDIQKTYGGGPSRGYYSSAYSISTNAYMLMYRQVHKQKNTEFLIPEEFPEHIKALLQCMQEQEERDRQQRELDRCMCKIKLFCQHPTQKRLMEMKLKVHKDCTLAEATQTAHTIMGLEGIVPLECCRLVKYDDFHDSLECSFDECSDEAMGELLGGVKTSYKFELFLEIKKPHEVFQEYKPGGTTIKVHVVDTEKEEVAIHPLTIRSLPYNTVQDLETQIAQTLGVRGKKIRVVIEAYGNEKKLLDDPTKTLISEGFKKSNKVFVEYKDSADAEKPYEESKLFKILDTYAHTICIHVSVPKIDKDNPEWLRLFYSSDEGKQDLSSEEDPIADNGSSTESSSQSQMERWLKDTIHNQGKPPPDASQDYDEGLGDSESSQPAPSHLSDQSEDSSLTDSERTLVGDELSPRNNSPDLSETEREPRDVTQPDWNSVLVNGLSSPEENEASRCCEGKRFFRAWRYKDFETGEQMLRVYVDKRITLAELKLELEPHIGVKANNFKIFRVYSNNQEFECTRLTDNLMSYSDDSRLTIKLGRALRKGEYRVKIYQLCLNEPEHIKPLIDWVLVKGTTVLQSKVEMLPYIRDTCGLDIPLNRCRLRKKNWKNPGPVYFDHQRFQKEIPLNTNWEMFLEVLSDDEPVTSDKQSTIFTRRWHPSTYKLSPYEEIVVDDHLPETLYKKLSEISQIPEKSIEFAKGQGNFPCEVSVLTIQKELIWVSLEALVNVGPLSIGGDGPVIYYRDAREELKKLTEEEKREIQSKENAKYNKYAKSFSSPRKEKALKIYTLDSTPSQNSRYSNSTTQQQTVPDLD